MEFKTLEDCWEYLIKVETIEELEKRFEDLPEWSGDWSWGLDLDEVIFIANESFDKEEDAYEEEYRYPVNRIKLEDKDEEDELKYLINKSKVMTLDKIETEMLEELLDKYGEPMYN